MANIIKGRRQAGPIDPSSPSAEVPASSHPPRAWRTHNKQKTTEITEVDLTPSMVQSWHA